MKVKSITVYEGLNELSFFKVVQEEYTVFVVSLVDMETNTETRAEYSTNEGKKAAELYEKARKELFAKKTFYSISGLIEVFSKYEGAHFSICTL